MVGEHIAQLEDKINTLCEAGDFSEELLELMAELEELKNDPDSYQPGTEEEDNQEDSFSHYQEEESPLIELDAVINEQENRLQDVIDLMLKEFGVTVRNNRSDYISVDLVYARGLELGLTSDDSHHVLAQIIQNARKRYGCYVLPESGFKGYDPTKDVWDNLKHDRILFDTKPLVFSLTNWEGDLTGDVLAGWSKTGFKFQIAQ